MTKPIKVKVVKNIYGKYMGVIGPLRIRLSANEFDAVAWASDNLIGNSVLSESSYITLADIERFRSQTTLPRRTP